MSVTPIRTGTYHRCELPTFMFGDYDYGDYDTDDVVRCDDCGRYWRAHCRRQGVGEWKRISRLAGWWIARRAKSTPSEGPAL